MKRKKKIFYYYNDSGAQVDGILWDDGTELLWDEDDTNILFDTFVAVWILATGVWNDAGTWIDDAVWID